MAGSATIGKRTAAHPANKIGKATAGKAFTPWSQPTSPPSGTYDPALAATVRQGNRGLADLLADTTTGNARALADYTFQTGDLNQQRARGAADLWQAAARERENYGTSTQGLIRNYTNLAANQTDAARAAGVAEGGALAQALAKRTANQGIEQNALDVGHQRSQSDISTQATRLNENVDSALGRALVDYQRGGIDRGTALSRATRENQFFGQDVGAQEWYQAAQSGYQDPGRPSNELGGGVNPYQVQQVAGHKVLVHPSGQIIGTVPKKKGGLRLSSQAVGFAGPKGPMI